MIQSSGEIRNGIKLKLKPFTMYKEDTDTVFITWDIAKSNNDIALKKLFKRRKTLRKTVIKFYFFEKYFVDMIALWTGIKFDLGIMKDFFPVGMHVLCTAVFMIQIWRHT